ncbi:MAG: M10 family metallopeptidase C-terminal domain-containing protein [Hyphomicrobiaceae bacterium]
MIGDVLSRATRDVPADISTTATLAVGRSYCGRIDTIGDSDWIAIQLDAGVTYTFNLGPAVANSSVPFDTTLGIYDASGTLVAFNDDVGFTGINNPGFGGSAGSYNTNSIIEFTPTVSGTFYLAASTLSSGTITGVGDYVLSAFSGDLPDGIGTPATLLVGGPIITCTLDRSGDVDGFSVETVAGQYYTVVVTATQDGASFPVPEVVARNSDGLVLGDAQNLSSFSTLATQLTFQATSSTTILDISSRFPGFDTGRYSIHIEPASLTDSIETNFPPLPANVNVYFAGNVDVINSYGESYLASGFTIDEKNAALRGFQQYSQIANVTFAIVDDPAQANLILLNRPGSTPAGQAALSFFGDNQINGVSYHSDVIEIFSDYPGIREGAFAPGTYGYFNLLHELGHTLGLSHPFEDQAGSGSIPGAIYTYQFGDFGLGQGVYTLMSYLNGLSEKDGVSFPFFYGSPGFGAAASPMAVDIAALQQIYGANTTTHTGDDTYLLPEVNGTGTGFVSIWDNAGADTIAAAATNTSGVAIDLRPASLKFDSLGGGAVSWAKGVQGGFTIANGVTIETAIGAAGNDRLVGNDVANRLEGQGGNDELGGGAGDDRLLGGGGNDRLFGDTLPGKPAGIGFGTGLIVNAAGANNNSFDTAWDITNSFALSPDPDVANSQTTPHVTIMGTGDGSDDVFKITLEKGAKITFDMDHTTPGLDTIILVGGPDGRVQGAFDDSTIGAGAGGSTSQLDPYGTFIAWEGGTYFFSVTSFSVDPGQSYVLHVSVPALTAAAGSGKGNDYLDGGDGNDYLDGDLGRDKMIGGNGDDTYVVDSLGDAVVERRNGGQDTILSFISLDITDFTENVENLTLTGATDLFGRGNNLNNTIIGNDGENSLKGVSGDDNLIGGAGSDRLDGGSGNDRLEGGLGKDRLEGGSGRDTFYFGDKLGSENVDTILDFGARNDHIVLADEIFLGLPAGSLLASAFKTLTGRAIVDSDDRILYDARSGDLFFDQDGGGSSHAAIRFANLINHANIGAGDFLIV